MNRLNNCITTTNYKNWPTAISISMDSHAPPTLWQSTTIHLIPDSQLKDFYSSSSGQTSIVNSGEAEV